MARECVRSRWPSIGVAGQYGRCSLAPLDDADHLRGVAPETLQAVVVALIGRKDVHDDAPVVEQDPARTTLPLDGERSNALLAGLIDEGAGRVATLAVEA